MTRGFFFDASLARVARELARDHPDVTYPGNGVWPLSQEAPDQDWLELVGKRDLCAVLRDKKIRYRPAERAALLRFRARTVNVTVGRNLTSAEYADLIRRYWDELEKVLEAPPAYYHLTMGGLKKMLDYPPTV